MAVQLKVHWKTKTVNIVEYHLDLNHNVNQHILELDAGGVGNIGQRPGGIHSNWLRGTMPHYTIGVEVTTQQGKRTMAWDSWYTHQGFIATREVYGNGAVFLTYPCPQELVRWSAIVHRWDHHRYDLQSWLEQLEPGNKIISVDTFVATGGNLDNITLTSN